MKSLATLLMIGWAATTVAQHTVSGKVVEEGTGEALPFANVAIKGARLGTTTNADGFFSLVNVPAGYDTLVVSYVGYETRSFSVPAPGRELQRYALKPIVGELTEVVVDAESYKVLDAASGISAATLSTRQLSNLPSIGETDIFRSLQFLPGVSGTNENSSGLFIRGGTPDQNLVLLDGMTVYKVDHFFGFFSAFNANAIKDVQLYKGAFPARYGGRISGVIDLTGKTGSFEKFSGGMDVNLLSINGYAEIPLSKRFSFLVAGRRSYTDILQSGVFDAIKDNVVGTDDLQNQVNANVATVEPAFYFYDWNTKLSYKPSERDMLTVSLYSGRDFLDESRDVERAVTPRFNPVTRLFKADITEKTDWGNNGVSAKWSRQWNGKIYTNTLVAASEYFSDYTRNAFIESSIPAEDSVIMSIRQHQLEDNTVRDYSARFDLEWKQSDRHVVEAGLSYTRTQVDYTNMRGDSLLLGRSQQADYVSLYLSNTWNLTSRATVKAGIRISRYELADDRLVERRAQLIYQLTDQVKLKFGYGRHYQFVSRIVNENITQGARDFWLLADDDLVDVSKAEHFICGASYEINNWFFDVEGYYKKMSGLSEFSLRFRRNTTAGADELFFTGEGVARGLEFLLQKKQGNYTGWATYTLGNVRHTFEAFNDGKAFPALQDQRHEFKMVHSYEVQRWILSATFIFGSGKPYTEPEGQYSITLPDGRTLGFISVAGKNGSRLPAYHRLDISANYKFSIGKSKANLSLSIFNFYNRDNIWYKQYDFSQDPVLITDVEYLGFTPNIAFGIDL